MVDPEIPDVPEDPDAPSQGGNEQPAEPDAPQGSELPDLTESERQTQDLLRTSDYWAQQAEGFEEVHDMTEGDNTVAGCARGCSIAALIFGMIFFVTLLAISGVDTPWGGGGDGEPSQNRSPSGQPNTDDDGFSTEGSSALADVFSADGLLVPMEGEWDILNEEGAATCAGDLTLEAHTQTGNLEVVGDGEAIVITGMSDDGSAEPIRLERVSATDSEAVYHVDLSEETGHDFEMELVFSSSSTLGGRLAGCPDRGGQGWLVEAASGGANEPGAEASGDTSEGDSNSEGESLQPPENLTIAFPDGGTVTGSVSDTGYAYVYVEYTLDMYDEVIVFYDDWTSTDSRDWSGGDQSYESQGTTVRSHVWNTAVSMIGITECTAGGLPGGFDSVCLQINEYEE